RGVQSTSLGQAGTKALHEDVDAVDELEQTVAVALEVEDDRALARVRREEERAGAVDERRSPGAGVVALRRLALPPLRAQRSEQLRARRPGERGGHVHDAHAGERLEAQCGCTQTSAGPCAVWTSSTGSAPSLSATRIERTLRGSISETIRSIPR